MNKYVRIGAVIVCAIAVALIAFPTAGFVNRMNQPIDNPITLYEEIDGETVATQTTCSRLSAEDRQKLADQGSHCGSVNGWKSLVTFCAITPLYGDTSKFLLKHASGI